MILTPETLLALGLIAVYLFDSMHFLQIGEAVVITRAASLQRISFGSGFELGGRRPFLPNPLTPFWPELRVDWVSHPTHQVNAQLSTQQMSERAAALKWTGAFSGACTALIVIGAPIALLLEAQYAFIACVLSCAICELVAAGLLFRKRKMLGLGIGQWLSLSLIALICLPCSANLARAAAKARCWTLPAHEIAGLNLNGLASGPLREQVREALLRARRYVDEESPEFQYLSEQLRLLGEGS
jgi:hypothetical protein